MQMYVYHYMREAEGYNGRGVVCAIRPEMIRRRYVRHCL